MWCFLYSLYCFYLSIFQLIYTLYYFSYTISLEIIRLISSTLFLFFRTILVILTHLIFHINFRIVMSIVTKKKKNLSWLLIGIMLSCIKLIHQFQES